MVQEGVEATNMESKGRKVEILTSKKTGDTARPGNGAIIKSPEKCREFPPSGLRFCSLMVMLHNRLFSSLRSERIILIRAF